MSEAELSVGIQCHNGKEQTGTDSGEAAGGTQESRTSIQHSHLPLLSFTFIFQFSGGIMHCNLHLSIHPSILDPRPLQGPTHPPLSQHDS